MLGCRRASGALGLALVLGWTPAAGAQGEARDVLAVFPMTTPGVPQISAAERDSAWTQVHAVSARGSEVLTVPRLAVRRAIVGSSGGAASRAADARVAKLARELDAAKARVRSARDAVDVALDDDDAGGEKVVAAAEAEFAAAQKRLDEAEAAASASKAGATARLEGGCVDSVCLRATAKKVGASKVLRPSFRTSGSSCRLVLDFFALDAGHTYLRLTERAACSAKGLSSAIDAAGAKLRAREKAGYQVYEQDLAAGRAIVNPPSTQTGRLTFYGAARDAPDEVLDVFVNGKESGAVRNGAFTMDLPHGQYVVVVKSRSPNFTPRRFDIRVLGPVRIPQQGALTFEPVFGAIEFDLVDGQWRLESGESVLVRKESNRVRPGEVPVRFFLEERAVGDVRVPVLPGQTAVVRVVERPKTSEELLESKTWWHIRMWGSLAAGLVAGGFGAQRMLAAQDAEQERVLAEERLALTRNNVDYTLARNDVVAFEEDRKSAQNVGLALLGAGGAFVVWSALEMIFGSPDEGELIAPGLEVYAPTPQPVGAASGGAR